MERLKTDRHHALYPRRDYLRGTAQYQLRTHHLLIPTIDYQAHHYEYINSVHRNVEPPEMPTEGLAEYALEFLKPLDGKIDHLQAIERLAYHLDRRSLLGAEIASNLMRQLIYIEPAYVRAWAKLGAS